TTFATEFLGCKVSMTDAQQVRERLAADGHREVPADQAAVRVLNTCCVTAEAVAKSRKAARRAARSAERVVVTGCGAALDGAFDGLPENVTVCSRLSSIEVDHLSDRLLRAVADTPGVARHLHVPMQSGSDHVLGAMRRHYAAAGFLDKMRRARELVDGLNLTSDVIVGHPSERVEDFGATLDAV